MFDTIKIYPNQYKNLLMLLACFSFCAIGIYLILLETKNLLDILIGIIGMVFFGLCAMVFITKLVQNAPMIEINPQGIMDKSTIWAIGLIKWQDIDFIKIKSFKNQSFIAVYLIDEKPYLRRMSFWQKCNALINKKMGFSIISLNTVGTNYSSEQLFSEIEMRLNYFHAAYDLS